MPTRTEEENKKKQSLIYWLGTRKICNSPQITANQLLDR